MVAQIIPVEPFDLTIFGASGDLARRKILPGLFRRMAAGQFDGQSRIIGAARTKMTGDEFRAEVNTALETYLTKDELKPDAVQAFLDVLDYSAIDIFTTDGWKELGDMQRDGVVRAFYYSVGPNLFGEISRRLTDHGLANDQTRIVVEKPFGHDLASAKDLNAQLRACFEEHQVYRIDHYLGKETVQNLMALRFGNALFEPLWNSHHIDHVEITASETIGVQGRGAYYDKSGAMRDMVQNHLTQLLCLTAMEPPSDFEANSVRNEKLKIINALEPVAANEVVRGQYRAAGKDASYIEDSENPTSKTESFLAMKVGIANWRWAGVPFYLRTGKKLRKRMTEIAIQFKKPPHSIFENQDDLHGNLLRIRLQPDEGVTLSMTIKEPGPGGMRLREVPLDMTFAEALGDAVVDTPDAYERLIMDVIRGNQTLFMRDDEVESAWAWVDPIIEQWQKAGDTPEPYDQGSAGPEAALMLLHKDGRRWLELD